MEIKPGMKVRLKTLEELQEMSSHSDCHGIESVDWEDTITAEMFAYLGTEVTVNGANRSGMFHILEDGGDWHWLPVWVDEIVTDEEGLPSPMTLRLDMYEQFREKVYFFCIADNPSNSPKAGWGIQVGNIHRQGEYEWFEDETLQGTWNKAVDGLTSVESF